MKSTKVNIYYGKVNKHGTGDIDILLQENVELKDVKKIIKDNHKKMTKGWASYQEGEHIEIDVYSTPIIKYFISAKNKYIGDTDWKYLRKDFDFEQSGDFDDFMSFETYSEAEKFIENLTENEIDYLDNLRFIIEEIVLEEAEYIESHEISIF